MGKITGTFDDRAWSQERTGEFECRRYLVLEKFGGRSSGRGLLMYDSCLAVKQAQRRCIPVKKRPKAPPKSATRRFLRGKDRHTFLGPTSQASLGLAVLSSINQADLIPANPVFVPEPESCSFRLTLVTVRLRHLVSTQLCPRSAAGSPVICLFRHVQDTNQFC
ncbi:MAG: hypothetical protein ACJ8BW_11735 [Ktedonobacteraceae bacterium]